MKAREKAESFWIVRDQNGQRVLGTADSLREAILQALNRGESFPILEQVPDPDEDTGGLVLWRRTL